MIEAVHEFLHLFENEPLPEDRRLRKLASALDRLSCAYHDVRALGGPEGYQVSDKPDYVDARALAAKYFPDFGLYPTIPPLSDINTAPEMGDAVDDLADIWKEMVEVKLLWDAGSASAAENQFKLGYEFHWGQHHLHPLRNYVNALIFQ
jgi:hypothetical protein